jgi:hypothetical protein
LYQIPIKVQIAENVGSLELKVGNGPVQRGRVEDLPFQKRWLSAFAATAGSSKPLARQFSNR